MELAIHVASQASFLCPGAIEPAPPNNTQAQDMLSSVGD